MVEFFTAWLIIAIFFVVAVWTAVARFLFSTKSIEVTDDPPVSD